MYIDMPEFVNFVDTSACLVKCCHVNLHDNLHKHVHVQVQNLNGLASSQALQIQALNSKVTIDDELLGKGLVVNSNL